MVVLLNGILLCKNDSLAVGGFCSLTREFYSVSIWVSKWQSSYFFGSIFFFENYYRHYVKFMHHDYLSPNDNITSIEKYRPRLKYSGGHMRT